MFRRIHNKVRAIGEIVNQIIENIQSGELKRGETLPAERTMAQIMGVSRPVVREALRSLEFLGVIKTVRGGKNYVSENLEDCLVGPLSILFRLSHGSVHQAQQLRSALERKAAFLAAQNCTPLDAAELHLIIAKLDAAQDEKTRGDLDRDLHAKIGKIAGNPLIFSVMDASAQITESIISGIRGYMMQKNHSAAEVDDQHRMLVEAIAGHREQEAQQCMEEHMKTIEKYILEIAKTVDWQE